MEPCALQETMSLLDVVQKKQYGSASMHIKELVGPHQQMDLGSEGLIHHGFLAT
jgi:hypothetical protein